MHNYHPNIFPIATSTRILNHKHLHPNRNPLASHASRHATKCLCYCRKNKHQHPQEKKRASRSLSNQILCINYRDSVQLPSGPASSTDAGESPPEEAFPGQAHQDPSGCKSLSVKQGEPAQIRQLSTKNCLLFFPIGLLKQMTPLGAVSG